MFNEEVVNELEALKSIYEGSLQIVSSGETCEVVYGNESGLQLNIIIGDTYPEQPCKVNVCRDGKFDKQLSCDLKDFATENSGVPVLYTLISKAEELYNPVTTMDRNTHEESESAEQPTVQPQKSGVNIEQLNDKESVSSTTARSQQQKLIVCKFFMKGKCKFKDKCHNLHPGEEKLVIESKDSSAKKQVSKEKAKDCHNGHPDVEKSERKPKVSKATKQKKQEEEQDEMLTKKVSMKTATDVIHRILWDDALPTEHFLVGYLDRFVGIIEKPFSAFSWEDIASVDYNVLAIPKHRIQYFKYLDIIVWDKNTRFDVMFGSTGNSDTIFDIMSNQNSKQQYSKKSGTEVDVKPERKHEERNRPNFFLTLRITDDNIKAKVKQAQHHIASVDKRLSEISHEADSLHITLLMMRLATDNEKAKATAVLKSLEPILPCIVPTNAFHLNVKFIEHFAGRRVVYAGVRQTTELTRLVDIAARKFKDAGVHLCGNFDVYTPHLTMMKISRPFSEETQIRDINPYLFEDICNMDFGKQTVDSLRICDVGKERGEDNFYATIASVENRLLSISNKLPSLIADNLRKQMSQGIVDEGLGDSLFGDILSNDGEKFEDAVRGIENALSESTWKSDKLLIIMRGLPGSGKSYLAANLDCGAKSKVVFSADMYFSQKDDGESYRFDGSHIDKAHEQCRDDVISAMEKRVDVIIVDNTHTQRWEYRVYERMALLCGYKHRVLEIKCDGEASRQEYERRCTHKVKEHVHCDMYTRWERDPQAILYEPRISDENIDLAVILLQKRQQPVLYSALFLDNVSRDKLLSIHPANLTNKHADHMTIRYEPTVEHLKGLPVGTPFRIKIENFVSTSQAQVVSVTELDSALCTHHRPHVTIATSKSFRPRNVSDMLECARASHATQRVVLTGVVGVQIATSESESVRCTDAYYYKKFLKDLMADQDLQADSNSGGVGSNSDLANVKNEDESKSFGVYVGPIDVVTCLNIFDFDSTLFFTPDPVEGRQEYQKLTGNPWPRKGWLSCNESLASPLHVYPGPSLPDYRSHVSRAGTYNVMCTGRLERVLDGVEGVLSLHGLTFDRLVLKPDNGQNFSRSNVKNYKRDVMTKLLKEFPKATTVNFWDDRIDNIDAVKSLVKYNRHVKFNLYHIQDKLANNIYKLPTCEVFRQLGLVQDEDYVIAVNEVVEILEKAWLHVLGVSSCAQQLLHFFGSYLLNRRSDVDICLLAPTSMLPDDCILKLSDYLKSYGFQFVHAAVGIRCPRLKLKAVFCDHLSISFDVVVACVLKTTDNDEFDILETYDRSRDKKSVVAMDGVVFARNVINPILDRISETDFGMLIDSLVILLRRNNLKGNAFHCVRTFHLVQCLAEFIGGLPLNALPPQGLDNLKDFEGFLRSVLKHFASISFDKFHSKFKGFVPDSFIQPLIDCFEQASKLSIEDILFQGPRLSSRQNKEDTVVHFMLKTISDIERWRYSTLLEARVGSFVRQLIDRGFSISPRRFDEGGFISFAVSMNGNQAKSIDSLVKCFAKTFEEECEGSSVTLRYGFS